DPTYRGDGGGERPIVVERYRYSVWGIPTVYAAADINMDGVVDETDNAAMRAAVRKFRETPSRLVPRADINQDGLVNIVDVKIYFWPAYQELINSGGNGREQLSYGSGSGVPEESQWYRGSDAYQQTHLDNRLGFAGYVWDPWLKVYHVRHRVYDPFDTRWLQADPIGYAGGDTDLRRYCNGDPVNFVDPMGLAGGAAGMTDEYWNNRYERRQNGPTSPASPLPPNAAGGFINGAGEQAYQLVWGSWMAKGEAIGNAAVGAWERAETTAGGIAGAAGAGAVELVHQTVVIPREVKDGIKTSLENVVSAVTGTDVSTGETLTAYERGERLGAFFIDALTAKIAVDGAGRPTRGTAPGQPASGAEKGGSCGGGGGTLTNADLKASAIGDHNQTGLSKAARAWDKHAAKEGSAIEKATGGVDAKNARASEFVDSV
ncbi:MAG: RHS repeat-associated core domain-containing protein, partial [bacterium]